MSLTDEPRECIGRGLALDDPMTPSPSSPPLGNHIVAAAALHLCPHRFPVVVPGVSGEHRTVTSPHTEHRMSASVHKNGRLRRTGEKLKRLAFEMTKSEIISSESRPQLDT
eukprot:2068256-Prymnesium_polylepis.2